MAATPLVARVSRQSRAARCVTRAAVDKAQVCRMLIVEGAGGYYSTWHQSALTISLEAGSDPGSLCPKWPCADII